MTDLEFSPFADGIMAFLGSRSHEWSFWQITEIAYRAKGSRKSHQRACLVKVSLQGGYGDREAIFTTDFSPSQALQTLFAANFTLQTLTFSTHELLTAEGKPLPQKKIEGLILSKNTSGLFMSKAQIF